MIEHDRKILTEDLVLRKAEDSDLDDIFRNIWSDEKIAETMLWEATKTREEAVQRMEKTKAYQSDNDAFFVCLRKTDEAIGFAGIKEISPGICEDSGICIARAHQRKGYGRQLLNALIDLVFEKRGAREFIYGCFHENEASAALCRSCGFVYSHSRKMTREWDGHEYVCDFYVLKKTEDETC